MEKIVIGSLLEGEKFGRELRATLREQGHRLTLMSFYDFMEELQTRGIVASRVAPRPLLGGGTSEELKYHYTGGGTRLREPQEEAPFPFLVLPPVIP